MTRERYIDASTILSAADKKKIFESNALKVYPRLARQIQKAKGPC